MQHGPETTAFWNPRRNFSTRRVPRMSAVRFVIYLLLALPSGLLVRPADSKFCNISYRAVKTQWVSHQQSYWSTWSNAIKFRASYRVEAVPYWKKIEGCCEGYEPRTDDDSKCYPSCPSGCTNGECRGPNDCACNTGYESSYVGNVSTCIPCCPKGCVNGVCFAPNECICPAGNRLDPRSGRCESPCLDIGNAGPSGCGSNAICIGPNVCQCLPGYATFENRPGTPLERNFTTSGVVCSSLCSPECGVNAYCAAPNECRCLRWDYQLDLRSNECFSICGNKTCVNGFCDSSGSCACSEGHKKHPFLDDVCDPICQHGCVNGKCTKPDVCECQQGYRKLTAGAADNVCVTNCTVKCHDGYCLDPNLCHCHPGYVQIVRQGNVTFGKVNGNVSSQVQLETYCLPSCEPACSAGSNCTAPNLCEPVRTPDCRFGWTGSKCDELVFCSVVLPGDDQGVPGPIVVPKRLVFRNGSTEPSDHDESNAVPDWGGPRCNDDCRFSLMASSEAGGTRITAYCYVLEVLNSTVGLLISVAGSKNSEGKRSENARICFVDAASSCNRTQSKSRGGIIAGSLGAAVLVAAAAAVGIFWFLRRRRSKLGARQAVYERDAMVAQSIMRINEESMDD